MEKVNEEVNGVKEDVPVTLTLACSEEEGPLETDSEQVVFPPPCSWYKSTVAAAREDLWAYTSAGIIVLVKSPHKQLQSSNEILLNSATAAAVGAPGPPPDAVHENGAWRSKRDPKGRRWPYFTIIGDQRNRYNCISFCQTPWNYLPIAGSPLVSGCEGGFVRIWNLDRRVSVYHHDNHVGHQVIGVDWSSRNHFLIYSIDEAASLTVWNVSNNSLRSMNFGKIVPTCLQSCPTEENLVCFGTRGGNILIVDTTGNGKILAKVRHEEEVVQAIWKPAGGDWDTLKSFRVDSKVKGPVLVSSMHSMKIPSLRIWNRGGQDLGLLQAWEKQMPNQHQRNFKIFSTAGWVKDPNSGKLMLVSSGRHGEVVAWSDGINHEVIHKVHDHNAIFALVQCGDILWSLSYEPIIVGWNLRTSEVECVIPTLKGLSGMAPSPVDHSRLIIGGTDSVIRVINWNQSYPAEGMSCTVSPKTSSRLKGKVTAVAWHPARDNCIGLGTDDGVLGIYELKDNNKYATMFERRMNGVVYTVQFGPSVFYEKDSKEKTTKKRSSLYDFESEPVQEIQDRARDFMLYACGGNSVSMIHPSKPSNHLVSVSKIIETSNPPEEEADMGYDSRLVYKATDISWSPDYSYFAVGYNDGRIELYGPPHLKLKCWIKCHLTSIQFLSWRGLDFLPGVESKERWLASASNDASTRLYNLSALFEPAFQQDLSAEPVAMISSEATLQGHASRVISCAWSPHDKYLLVTVSYDTTAIVWNVLDGTPIARYMGHQQRLVACCFHPTDPYKVITASDELTRDFGTHVWDYRKHPFCKTITKSKTAKAQNSVLIKGTSGQNVDVSSVVESSMGLANDAVLLSNGNQGEIQPTVPHGRVHVNGDTQHPSSSDAGPKGRRDHRAKSRSLLPATSNDLVNAKHSLEGELRFIIDKTPLPVNCIGEESTTNNPPPPVKGENEVKNPTIHLGLLGNKKDCLEQILVERKGHEEKSVDNAAILSNWMGDQGWIKKAIKNRQVTESIIIMAAAVSRTLYLEAVEVYAEKLLESEEYVRAANFFIMIGKRPKAIDLLVQHKMFREVIAMMKLTLPDDDPQITQVMSKWAVKVTTEGNFELAAKIYASMGQYSNAIEVIQRRALPYAYRAGCYLAHKNNDVKKLEMFSMKFLLDGMARGCLQESKELIKEFPTLEWLKVVLAVHEEIKGFAKYLDSVSSVKDFKMWTMILKNSLESLRTDVACYDENQRSLMDTKISSNILISISQSEADAHLIAARDLALILLRRSEIQPNSTVEVAKLVKPWLAKKSPSSYFAIVMMFSQKVPEWNLAGLDKNEPVDEGFSYQLDATLSLIDSMIQKSTVGPDLIDLELVDLLVSRLNLLKLCIK